MENIKIFLIENRKFLILFIGGLLFLIYAINKRYNKHKKHKNTIKGKILDVKPIENIDDNNNFHRRTFYTKIEYVINNTKKTAIINCPYCYETQSIVDITVRGTSVDIASPPPQMPENHLLFKDDNTTIIGALLVGVFLVLLSIIVFSFSYNFYPYIILAISLAILLFILLYFFVIAYKKSQQKRQDIQNGKYKKIIGKVAQIKKVRHVIRTNGHRHVSYTYHLIIEYQNTEGQIRTLELPGRINPRHFALNQEIPFYLHIETGEILRNLTVTNPLIILLFVIIGLLFIAGQMVALYYLSKYMPK